MKKSFFADEMIDDDDDDDVCVVQTYTTKCRFLTLHTVGVFSFFGFWTYVRSARLFRHSLDEGEGVSLYSLAV